MRFTGETSKLSKALVLFVVLFVLLSHRARAAEMCENLFQTRTANSATPKLAAPRKIDSEKTFDALVQWIYNDLIVKRRAPGLVVGISGTDSIVAFLAAAKAFEKAGRPDRVAGVHYAPSEEFLDDFPEARAHLWFRDHVIPWLKVQAPLAQIVVDTSIDFRRDGLRWGSLMDWSVIENLRTRKMRPPDQQFWVVGTRNASEEALFTYSNASTAASIQILTHLWKSEVLQISKFLRVPDIAIDKSCEVDCVCGHLRLPAHHIPEVDALLMNRAGILDEEYVRRTIAPQLRVQLMQYIDAQIAGSGFKASLPYEPTEAVIHLQATNYAISNDVRTLTSRFEDYGLSFPQWRFLTQRFGSGRSLAEAFGMQRLVRSTDVRDASLVPSDPGRDELGPGFAWSSQNLYIEYRRAYIVVASLRPDARGTLVIRNNSRYFGADRLPEAVSFSLEPLSIERIQNLTARDLNGDGAFRPLSNFFVEEDRSRAQAPEQGLSQVHDGRVSRDAVVARVRTLLDSLDMFNARFSRWLIAGGRNQLIQFLDEKIKTNMRVYLATRPIRTDAGVPTGAPSEAALQAGVKPRAVVQATPEFLDELREKRGLLLETLAREKNLRLILMSGPSGD